MVVYRATSARVRRPATRLQDPLIPSTTIPPHAASPAVAGPAPREPRRRWRDHAIAVVLIIAAALLFMNPIFRGDTLSNVPGHQNALYPWLTVPNGGSDAFPQSDQADTFHPLAVFAERAVDAGDLPLWNPDSLGGTPFVANGGTGILDPVRLGLLSTVPASWVHDLLLLFQFTFLGIAMYVLAIHLRLGILASLFAAFAWQFGAAIAGWVQLETFTVAGIAIPLGIVLLDRFIDRPTLGRGWAAATVVGLLMLSANVQTMAAIGVVLALYGIPRLIAMTWRAPERWSFLWRRALGLVGVSAAVGVIMSPLILPTLQALQHTSRATTPVDALLAPGGHVAFDQLLSSTFTRPLSPPVVDTLHILAFVGLITAILAIVGIFLRSRASTLGRWFGLFSLLIVTGTFVTRIAYAVLPGLSSFQHLGRLTYLWSFAVVLLAASAFDMLVRQAATFVERRRGTWTDSRVVLARRGIVAVAGILIAINLADVARVARSLNPPFLPRTTANLFPETPAITAARDSLTATGGNLLPLTYTRSEASPFTAPVFYASSALLYPGVRSVAGYESLALQRTTDFWRIFNGEPREVVEANPIRAGFIPTYTSGTVQFGMLPSTGISTILGPPNLEEDPAWQRAIRSGRLKAKITYRGFDGVVAQIVNSTPRARVVFGVDAAASETDAFAKVVELGPRTRQTAVLETSTDRPAPSEAPPVPVPARVDDESVDEVTASGTSPRAGWLVLTDSWAPGWSARVNGKETPVVIANGAQRAVAVPAGAFTVEFVYQPLGWYWAPVLAIVVVLGGGGASLGLLLRDRRARRTTAATESE